MNPEEIAVEKLLKKKYKVLLPVEIYQKQLRRSIQGDKSHLIERDEKGNPIHFMKSYKERIEINKLKADWKILNRIKSKAA
jgi:hypothetical protein